MTDALPSRTLMMNFLNDAIRSRRITLEHLADLMQPTSEDTLRSWLNGWSAPSAAELAPLAAALRISPVDLTAGWIIDQHPELDTTLRQEILNPLTSRFPRPADLNLIAPRRKPDMNVGDPHDEREPRRNLGVGSARVRKRSPAARP